MSRNCRRFTNEKIRQEITEFITEIPPGERFCIDGLTEHIQGLHPKALINNRRIGLLLKERDDLLRIGQRKAAGLPYENNPVFWMRAPA